MVPQEYTSLQYSHDGKESTRKEHQSYPAPSAQGDKACDFTMLSETKPFLEVAVFFTEQLNDGRATELSLPEGATSTFS